MAKEYYIDGLGNISVQGPIVTLTLTRSSIGSEGQEKPDDEVLNLTMTGPNLLKITNILNNTIKRLAQRSQETAGVKSESVEATPPKAKIKKDKSVN
tara:strand:- start:307 stop:597 length:291 start_codon:yes stop_codon:yes gene_type:complete